MRNITHHIDPFGAADIKITCDDTDPNAGGASHAYDAVIGDSEDLIITVNFQHGPRGADGKLTGAIDAALAAILIDRMECFQAGPFAHESNDRALNHFRDGLDILRSRAAERKARGVLGQNKA
jgi:hypothetical protein